MADEHDRDTFYKSPPFAELDPDFLQYPFFSWEDFAIDNGSEWFEWTEKHAADLPDSEACEKRKRFETVQVVMYRLLGSIPNHPLLLCAFITKLKNELQHRGHNAITAKLTLNEYKYYHDYFTKSLKIYQAEVDLHEFAQHSVAAVESCDRAKQDAEAKRMTVRNAWNKGLITAWRESTDAQKRAREAQEASEMVMGLREGARMDSKRAKVQRNEAPST